MRLFAVLLLVSAGCSSSPALDAGAADSPGSGDAPPAADAGADTRSDAGLDAGGAPDTPADGASCLGAHTAGDHYPVGDACNFCDCAADGTETCTARTCVDSLSRCTYDGTDHGYGERFAATDGCNECVCAASGLACTRRTCSTAEEGAMLLESLDDACGADAFFTPRAVLDGLPGAEVEAPFLYDRARTSYPESLPDTTVTLRVSRENDFFAVCRLPDPSQPAIDMQVTLEWITADGALDEAFPAYLRRNGFGFVDAWYVLASAPLGTLFGSYVPNCSLDPGDYAFEAQWEPDGHAFGSVTRVCETDLALTVATFDHPAP